VWEWDSPWSSLGFPNLGDYNANANITDVALIPNSVGEYSTSTAPSEFLFTTGINGVINGYLVNFGISQQLPTGYIQLGSTAGYPGSSVVINGTNFDTTGLTEVFFNGSRSPSVSCSSSTQCTAVAPVTGSVPSGSVPVTVELLGNTVNVGTFAYLPAGPKCQYSYTAPTPAASRSAATFDVACTPDAAADPIWVYQLIGSGEWQLVYYSYPMSSGSPVVPFMSTSVGSSSTFIACNESNVRGFASPGENGCDGSSSTVSIPLCIPATESATCAAAAICTSGLLPDGCGGTVNCEPSDCSTGNCTLGHCCDVGTTWYANKCYAPGVVTCPTGYEYCGAAEGCVKGKCS